MTAQHPVVVVTGSSGAGTTSVMRIDVGLPRQSWLPQSGQASSTTSGTDVPAGSALLTQRCQAARHDDRLLANRESRSCTNRTSVRQLGLCRDVNRRSGCGRSCPSRLSRSRLRRYGVSASCGVSSKTSMRRAASALSTRLSRGGAARHGWPARRGLRAVRSRRQHDHSAPGLPAVRETRPPDDAVLLLRRDASPQLDRDNVAHLLYPVNTAARLGRPAGRRAGCESSRAQSSA